MHEGEGHAQRSSHGTPARACDQESSRSLSFVLLALTSLRLLTLAAIPSFNATLMLDEFSHLCGIVSNDCSLADHKWLTQPRTSLVVIVPPGGAVDRTVSSCQALDDGVLLHWGSCSTVQGPAPGVLRQACVPTESDWHPGRALNLAASLTSGSLLVVIDSHAYLADGLFQQLLSLSQLHSTPSPFIHRAAAAGLIVVSRAWLLVARGWDERLSTLSAGSAIAVHDDLVERLYSFSAALHIAPMQAGLAETQVVGNAAVPVLADVDADEAGLGLLIPWHASRLLPTLWELKQRGACEATSLRRSSVAPEATRDAADARRAVLRQQIYQASHHAVTWSALQHTQSLADLHALDMLWSYRAPAGKTRGQQPDEQDEARPAPFLLVHVHSSLPRRLLAFCSARAYALRVGRRLVLVWPRENVFNTSLMQLFVPHSPSLRDTVDPSLPLPVLSEVPPAHVPSRATRVDAHGSLAAQRANPVHVASAQPNAPLYVRAADALETQPPIETDELRLCLLGLEPVAAVGRLQRHAAPTTAADEQHMAVAIGVHLRRGTAGRAATAAARGVEACSLYDFAQRSAMMPTTAPGSVALSMDGWQTPGLQLLPPPFAPGVAVSLAAVHRLRCGMHGTKRPKQGERGAACEQVAVAEWRLLAAASTLLLTGDSAFSALVAATAAPATRIWYAEPTKGGSCAWRRAPAVATREWREASALSAIHAVAQQHVASLRRYVVDDKARLIFCLMPKVACTSFRMWLRRLAGASDWLDLSKAHSRLDPSLTTLADYDAPARKRLLGSYRKAVFVRDPWSRLLSAYLNKFVEEPEGRRRNWLKELLRPLRDVESRAAAALLGLAGASRAATRPSFATFLALLNASAVHNKPLMNEHWAAQADLCALQTLRYDFVGDMKQLAADVAALGALLGMEVPLPKGGDYGWEGNNNASRQLEHYYQNHALVSKVSHIYASDVAAPLNSVYHHGA